MTATFVHVKDPFRHQTNREISEITRVYKISTVLRKNGLLEGRGKARKRVGTYVVGLNGEAVLEAQWDNLCVRDGDVLTVAAIPLGGDGSNPLQIVAMVAIMVLAVYSGGAAASAFGSQMAGMAVQAGVMIAGTLLLNMVFPPPSSDLGSLGRDQASPSYSLSASGNSARLMQAIPRLYGRFCVTPDFAAQPYTEFVGNEQYLYQLFCVSQGEIEIERMRIEQSDLSSFGEIEYEIIPPGGQVTLFPDNVTVSSAIDQIEMRAPATEGPLIIGPHPTNPSGTLVQHIAVDITFPQGIFTVNNRGALEQQMVGFQFEYRQINDLGSPMTDWMTLQSSTLTMATRDAQRITYKISVPMGRYEVRGWRNTSEDDEGRSGGTCYWTALRGYHADVRNYGNVTMIALIYKATELINSNTARRFNVIATSKLRTWDPVNGWSLTKIPTGNPAWVIGDMCTDPDYGRGMPTSRINMTELYRLSQVWQSRGDMFNGVFDTVAPFWESLKQVAAVGRAVPVYTAGQVDIVRNEPKTLRTAVFTPAKMLRGSFSTNYKFADPDTPDHVIVEYVDDVTWQPQTVSCVLPGMTALKPARLRLMGVTNRDQAWREGMSRAAANRDQRRKIEFQTRGAGMLPRFNDLCAITHDVPVWGQSGKVKNFNRSTGIVELTEDMRFGTGKHFISFRKKNGSEDGPYECVSAGSGNRLQLVGLTNDQKAAIWISPGVREDYTEFVFGPSERIGLNALLLTARNDEEGTVTMTFTNYAESVHTAETGGIVPPPGPASELPGAPVAPVVDWVRVDYMPFIGQQTVVASAASGAIYYEFTASPDNGGTWQNLGQSATPQIFTTLAPGPWLVRCRAVGRAAGPWATWSGVLEATTLPVPVLSHFTATGGMMEIKLDWLYAGNSSDIAESVEIWAGTTDVIGLANKVATLPYPATTWTMTNLGPGDRIYFWARMVDKSGRLSGWFNNGTPIIGTTISDAGLLLEYLTNQITDTQLSQQLLDQIEGGGGAMVEVEAIKSDLAAMYTIKTQMSAGGRTVMAGIGVGVENNQGILESQVLVYANRFGILTDVSSTGAPRAVFVVDAGIVYMDTAFIKNGTITNAKIGGALQSDNYIAGVQGWRIDKVTGVMEMNSPLPGGGRLVLNSQAVIVYDANGIDRARFGYIP